MARIKSLVTRVKIGTALRAHNCQANRQHRVLKGDTRLSVRNGRSWDNYCLECARKILANDLQKLQEISLSIKQASR